MVLLIICCLTDFDFLWSKKDCILRCWCFWFEKSRRGAWRRWEWEAFALISLMFVWSTIILSTWWRVQCHPCAHGFKGVKVIKVYYLSNQSFGALIIHLLPAMVPTGPPNPMAGGQPMPPSLLRTNSGVLGGSQAAQSPFSSLVSARNQLGSNGNNMSLLGSNQSVSSLLNHSFGNGSSGTLMNLQQRVGVNGHANMIGSGEPDTQSFNTSAGQLQGQQHFQNHSRNQLSSDNLQSQQLEGAQNFQRQFSLTHNQQQQVLGGLGNVSSLGSVKLEPQMGSAEQHAPPQQLQSVHNIGAVKIEPQQLQSMRNLGQVKLEHQHSDPSVFLHQQQQQLLQLSRQSNQAAAARLNLMQQQRMLQLQQQQQQHQQQQQQQILRTLPQQRAHLQQQLQQSLSIRSQVKPMYEPGMCARRLTNYIYYQKCRPEVWIFLGNAYFGLVLNLMLMTVMMFSLFLCNLLIDAG